MTKPQKRIFKKLKKPAERAGFVEMLVHQQMAMGRYSHWRPAYLKKCAKRGVKPTLPV